MCGRRRKGAAERRAEFVDGERDAKQLRAGAQRQNQNIVDNRITWFKGEKNVGPPNTNLQAHTKDMPEVGKGHSKAILYQSALHSTNAAPRKDFTLRGIILSIVAIEEVSGGCQAGAEKMTSRMDVSG